MNKIFIILFLLFLNFFLFLKQSFSEENKIKIGLLVPLSGDNIELGKQIVKATRMALKDINSNEIEIYPKDTQSDPNKTLSSAIELSQMGINLVIGPVFYQNLIYLDEVNNITFLSLTNKTLDLPKNVISTGINSTSQLNTIKKFIELQNISKTIFLSPNLDYDLEVKKGIKNSKIKIFKKHYYDIEPTKLTKQIEKITNYDIRKQNLFDEITRLENSEDENKEIKIENLKKRYTLGGLNFDSIVIADFDESLKSVVTSLIYTDVLPQKKYLISISSKVLDGRIFLTGKVENPEEKLRLTKLAWETDGVRSVRNDIKIKEEFNFQQSAKDILITSQLRTAMILNKNIKATNYQIDTYKKRIYVYGIAITSEEKKLVIEEANEILDVENVIASILLVDDLRIQNN